jgi:hypothetical protein
MGWELLGEHWRPAVVGATGLLVLLLRRRVPRWLVAAWVLLTTAVALGWLVGMSWPGTLVILAGLVFVASAFWLRAEERRAMSATDRATPVHNGPHDSDPNNRDPNNRDPNNRDPNNRDPRTTRDPTPGDSHAEPPTRCDRKSPPVH